LDIEDAKTVADDIEYLGTWDPDIAEGEIRRGSAVLRRLLIEDAYGQAWRYVGKERQPKLIAVDLSPFTQPDILSQVKYAIALGANFRGAKMACALVGKGSTPLGGLGAPIREDGYPGEREFSLSEFLTSPSGIVDGKVFSRSDVIKYIANVRGGVHLGRSARRAEKKLVARLGKIDKKLTVQVTDALLVELVATVQAIAMSRDAADFIVTAKGT
jgi:hypothetical protein